MSRDFPALIDPWGMVKGRRGFSGTWPIARLPRLADAVEDVDGEASFEVQFDRDETGMPFVEILVEAQLALQCQRTLEVYRQPVRRLVRLGLLEDERDEAALPAGYEPLIVGDTSLRLVDLVEDELILALPLVPRSGDTPVEHQEFDAAEDNERNEGGTNPFAQLAALKKK